MTVWLTTRAAGVAALLLLTAATSLGAATSTVGRPPASRFVLQYVHRVLAALGLAALVLHVLTVIADSYAGVGVSGALVPFTSGYRATAVALGTIATYLMCVVAALGFARGRMASSPRAARIWRGVHASAYAGWAVALLHGFLAGTDSSLPWIRLLYLACLAVVPAALAVRLSVPNPKRAARSNRKWVTT
jgi:sulfoxide reductase heme-binding subunit YedZ